MLNKAKLAARYTIIKPLGEGFGGAVFLVDDQGKQVALKQLQLHEDPYLSKKELIENFKSEFTTLKKLHHPHILKILDFGFDEKSDLCYFTTEYIEGQDIFEATRGLSVDEIEELFVQILRALSYLHGQRIYHLDIKPNNILVTQDNAGKRIAKLIDFGLSAFRAEGIIAGSPPFMAPEALLKKPQDGRSDLYSLGVTWYQCLSGNNPFKKDSLEETVNLHRIWMPPPISSQGATIPPYLDPILEKTLKKNPAERYHRADQVIRDLNRSGHKTYPLETEATALSYLPGEGRLVGREKEMTQLLSHFDAAFKINSQPKSLIVITGADGTGKSRLLRELKYHAQLEGLPVYDLGTFSPEKIRGDCVVLDDDADSRTLETLLPSLQKFRSHNLLVCLAGRDLHVTNPIVHSMVLPNFDRNQVSDYIASVLGMEDPPRFLVDEILSRTDGNPRLITETLSALIASHQIFDDQGRWSPSLLNAVGIDFDKLVVPKTLNEYCQKQYEGLPVGAQKMLALVALSKTPLSMAHLHHIIPGLTPEDLQTLYTHNLIKVSADHQEVRLTNPHFSGWISSHLSRDEVAKLHEILGCLLHSLPTGSQAAEYHLGLGQSDPGTRFHHLITFGESCLENYRWSESDQAFQLAAQLAPSITEKVSCLLKRAQALFRSSHATEALELLKETRQILKQERENPDQWKWVEETYEAMGKIYLKAGRLELSREAFQSARALLETHVQDSVQEMILDNYWAGILAREGKLQEAESMSESTHQHWLDLPKESQRKIFNNELANIYLSEGKFQKAQKLFQEYSHFYDEIGNSNRKAHALYGLANCLYLQNLFTEAIPVYQECISLSRSLRNEELLFHALNGLGNIAYLQQDWKSAGQNYQDALDLAQHYASLESSVAIAINLARVLRHEKDYSSSLLYLRHVLDTLESQPSASVHRLELLAEAYIEMGHLSADKTLWDDARDAYRDAVKLTRHHPALEKFRFDSMRGLLEADLKLKKDQEAKTLFLEMERNPLSDQEKSEINRLKQNFQTNVSA